MPPSKYLIYGLVDPRDGQLRYVGQTNQLPCQRLAQHEHAARRMKDRRRNTQWLRSLQVKSVRPEMLVLEEGLSKFVANETESFYITYFRMVGCRLNNHTMGGEGSVGYKHNDEARSRISAGLVGKGWSEERKLASRALSAESELALVSMYRSGAPLSTVAGNYELSPSGVVKVLERHSVERRSPNTSSEARVRGHRKLDDVAEMGIVDLYLNGLSTEDAGADVGLGGRAVAAMLRRRGVTVRSSGAGRWLTERRKAT